MPQRKTKVLRDLINLLLNREGVTQKSLSNRLSVSERTIRRWKNEGVKPRSSGVFSRVVKLASVEKKRLRSRAKRAGVELPDISLPPDTKKLYWRDPNDDTREFESDTVSYDVHRFDTDYIIELLRYLRDERYAIRLVYKVPAGQPEYSRSSGRSTIAAKTVRAGTIWERDWHVFTNVEIDAYVADLSVYKILYVMAISRKNLTKWARGKTRTRKNRGRKK